MWTCHTQGVEKLKKRSRYVEDQKCLKSATVHRQAHTSKHACTYRNSPPGSAEHCWQIASIKSTEARVPPRRHWTRYTNNVCERRKDVPHRNREKMEFPNIRLKMKSRNHPPIYIYPQIGSRGNVYIDHTHWYRRKKNVDTFSLVLFTFIS